MREREYTVSEYTREGAFALKDNSQHTHMLAGLAQRISTGLPPLCPLHPSDPPPLPCQPSPYRPPNPPTSCPPLPSPGSKTLSALAHEPLNSSRTLGCGSGSERRRVSERASKRPTDEPESAPASPVCPEHQCQPHELGEGRAPRLSGLTRVHSWAMMKARPVTSETAHPETQTGSL